MLLRSLRRRSGSWGYSRWRVTDRLEMLCEMGEEGLISRKTRKSSWIGRQVFFSVMYRGYQERMGNSLDRMAGLTCSTFFRMSHSPFWMHLTI